MVLSLTDSILPMMRCSGLSPRIRSPADARRQRQKPHPRTESAHRLQLTGGSERQRLSIAARSSYARSPKVSATWRAPSIAREGAKPIYTIPENATLMGSVAMTALIGRVPVDGTVNDPYPFKVLVGPENLTANGIDLPEVAGAVMSGTASGDWTLSCVRGQVESITFVFTDGTIRTVPQPASGSQPQCLLHPELRPPTKSAEGSVTCPIRMASRCIAGERRSNAQQYLGSQSLITAAGAGVAALLGGERNDSSVINSGGSTLGVTSSTGNSALNSILSGGVSDIREWVKQALWRGLCCRCTCHRQRRSPCTSTMRSPSTTSPRAGAFAMKKTHASLPDLD